MLGTDLPIEDHRGASHHRTAAEYVIESGPAGSECPVAAGGRAPGAGKRTVPAGSRRRDDGGKIAGRRSVGDQGRQRHRQKRVNAEEIGLGHVVAAGKVHYPRRARDNERRAPGIAALELRAIGRDRVVEKLHVIRRVGREGTAELEAGSRIDGGNLVAADFRRPAILQQVVTHVIVGIVALKKHRISRDSGACRNGASELRRGHVGRVSGGNAVRTRLALHGYRSHLPTGGSEVDLVADARSIVVGDEHLSRCDQAE